MIHLRARFSRFGFGRWTRGCFPSPHFSNSIPFGSVPISRTLNQLLLIDKSLLWSCFVRVRQHPSCRDPVRPQFDHDDRPLQLTVRRLPGVRADDRVAPEHAEACSPTSLARLAEWFLE